MKQTLVLTLMLMLAAPAVLRAQQVQDVPHTQDREGVRQAVLNYVEGLYMVSPERIKQSVHPDIAKVGYWRPSADTWYRTTRQDYDKLLELAQTWNADGHVDVQTAPRQVIILDVMDQTASAKLIAEWGVDYLHLAKIEGQWMIMNVLWQTPAEGYARQGGNVRVKTGGS